MLNRLQQDFHAALLKGDELAVQYVAAAGLDPSARLNIYRNHLFISLTEALKATFPTIFKLVGEAYFNRLAREFIISKPPQGPCLFEYGASFSNFITHHPVSTELPYLSDCAEFDWIINFAYHAEDAPPLDPAVLQSQPPEVLAASCLALHPSVNVLTSDYPIDAIWRANQKPEGEEDAIDLSSGGVSLLVWRGEDDVEWRLLALGEAVFIRSLKMGSSLSVAAETAFAKDENFHLTQALAQLIAANLIIGLTVR